MTRINYRTFGNPNRPTIYYFTGYGGIISRYLVHIYSLVLSGYRVFAFDYDKSILSSGDPKSLLDAIDNIEKIIKADMKNRKIAGVYAISLGTWISGAIMMKLPINRVVFNSVGCSLAGVVWNRYAFKDEKLQFQHNSYEQHDLEDYWSKRDIRVVGNGFRDKTVLVLNGTDDQIVDVNEARQTVRDWSECGNEVTMIEVKGLNHAGSIMRHALRVKKVARFFREI